MPDLKFSVLIQAVDKLSDKLASIGGGIRNLGQRASAGAERLAALGERMTGFGEKLSLVTALVSEGASSMREWSDALSEPAMAMEHSFATMAAVTDLSDKALGQIHERAVAFSNTHPGVTAEQWADGFTQLRGVYQDTAKAMKAEDVAAQMGRFGLDSQSAIHLLATAQTAYGVSAQQMGDQFLRTLKLFPLVNENARQYAAALGRLGGFAQTSNTPLSQMNAIIGEATQFMGSRGLTTIQTLFSGLQEKAAEGKSDIDTTHGALNALFQIRERMRGMSGTQQIGFLKDIGISATDASLFIPFITNLDRISAGQKKVEKGADTLAKAYGKATGDAADQVKLLHQNVDNFYDALYTPALPTVNRWLGDLIGTTRSASGAVEKHSGVARTLALTVTGVGAAGVYAVQAMGSLGAAWVFAGQGFKALSKLGPAASSIVSFGSSLFSAIPAVTAFGAALLANPLTWYVAGAVALGLAAYEIYEHWGQLGAWFSRQFSAIGATFHTLVSAIDNFGSSMYDAGKNLVMALGRGIEEGAMAPVHAIEGVAKMIRAHLPFSPAEVGPLKNLNRVRISETIADRIRPAPILSAITRTAAAVAIAAPLMAVPAAAAFGPGQGSAARAGAAAAAPIVHYAPVINGSGLSEEALLRTLEAHAYELRRILNREDARRERTELK